MLNRRHFIQAGLASAIPLASGATSLLGAGSVEAGVPAIPVYTLVYDERFPDSVAFAREARRVGQRVAAIRGDVTQLWYDDLYHRWQQGAVAIAGMTSADALFCLQTFGNDAGLRLRVKVEHRQAGTGHVEHRFRGPQLAFAGASLETCGSNWAGRMAELVVGCPAGRGRVIETSIVSRSKNAVASGQQMLVSWLLAPRQPA